MLIAQISDIHLSTLKSPCEEIYHTAEHLARAVAHLNALVPRPDVVLATGDLVERGEAEEYERLHQHLEPLRMPVYLIPGNHDDRVTLAHVFEHHRYLPRDGGFIQYTVEDWPVRLVALEPSSPGRAVGGSAPSGSPGSTRGWPRRPNGRPWCSCTTHRSSPA